MSFAGVLSRSSWSRERLSLEPQWQWLPYSFSTVTLRSCVSPDLRQLLLTSQLLVWQRRRCSGPAGSGGRFWELFLKAPLSAHSCSPFSDFVSAQPLNSLRALS